MSEKVVICFGICWQVILVALLLACGSYSFDRFKNYSAYYNTGTSQLTNLYDMGRDWQRPTFSNLTVTDMPSCPPTQEALYERIFYGMRIGCDCIGIYDRYINTDNEFVLDTNCDRNQTRAGCRTATPFPAVRMQQFNNRRICGTPTGVTYLNAVLPIKKKDEGFLGCPEGYSACI